MTIALVPGSVSIETLAQLYWNDLPSWLHASAKPGIENAARIVAEASAGSAAVYGVNTGFGKLASIKIASKDTATLQRNLILSHCCGVGEPIPSRIARLMMTLKLISLGRGASGVRWEIISLIQDMLEKGVTPIVPAQGSVGASGDRMPSFIAVLLFIVNY